MSVEGYRTEVAFTELQSTIARGLELIAVRTLGDLDEGRDAVQEILARAIATIREGRVPDGVPLGAFVHGIARHVFADVLRRRVRRRDEWSPETTPLPNTSPTALEQIVAGEDRVRVRKALAQLPPEDRAVLIACFVHGERLVAIADRLGQPPERIRKRKSRALEITGSGQPSCIDQSVGSGTAGTANTWTGNQAPVPSSPVGICGPIP